MRRWLPLWLLIALGCGVPDDIENASIGFDFGGQIFVAGTETPISGIRVNLVQLDSMNAAGMGVTVTSDTSSTAGNWLMHIEVAHAGSACADRTQPLMVTLRFTDPRSRYAPTAVNQTICRFTVVELNAARSITIGMTAN